MKRALLTGFGFLVASVHSATAAPMTQVTNDLWDVSKGTVITSSSPNQPYFPSDPLTGILGFANGPQLAQDSFFADGEPAGFAHFIDFKTTAPVTVRSLNVWGGDDRNGGVPGARSFSEFKLYGWNGSAYVLVLDKQITLPYANQGPIGSDGALVVQADIPGGYTSDMWRAEFIQPPAINGTLYGPRVLEMDGFGTFLDGTTGPAPVGAPLPGALVLGSLGACLVPAARRWSRRSKSIMV